ncbi:MAG: type II toxin-antitoxin system HicA family toxin [Dehalococcoidales bacterium]|nr:type II toxin-antitoxin system HicA family toxin [Dehalococcoidales bacterium]
MNYRELTRRLKSLGCFLDRSAKGSHEIWMNLQTEARTTIPNWGSHDLKPGTISGILRDLGIRKDDFDKG